MVGMGIYVQKVFFVGKKVIIKVIIKEGGRSKTICIGKVIDR